MKNRLFKFVSVLFVSIFFSGLAMAASDANMDIIMVASKDKDLSTFVEAVQAADLVNTLKGKGPFTVFAPTNEAFAKLPKETLDKLMKDKVQLVAVLTYHVVPGKAMAKDIPNGVVTTVEGQNVKLAQKGDMVTIGEAKIVKADVLASNGIIHHIDVVLTPPAK